MAESLIQGAVDYRESRDEEQKGSTGKEDLMDIVQESPVLGDMLEYVHQDDGISRRRGIEILEVAVNNPHPRLPRKTLLQEGEEVIPRLNHD
jgi:hypothetical protein